MSIGFCCLSYKLFPIPFSVPEDGSASATRLTRCRGNLGLPGSDSRWILVEMGCPCVQRKPRQKTKRVNSLGPGLNLCFGVGLATRECEVAQLQVQPGPGPAPG